MKRKKRSSSNYYVDIFDKKYEFRNNESWQLPQAAFADDHWELSSFQDKKEELNETKEKLNDFDLAEWSLHTKKRDPSTLIIKTIRKQYNPELLTQAWCKFYECLSRFDLVNARALERGSLCSLHLCEAPGGFISALNHYLQTKHNNLQLRWFASTLNPSYEGNPTSRMIPDDRLIKSTKGSWLFGADNTGDILKLYNSTFITDEVTKRCKGKVDLITADGSIDCMSDPGNQERHVEHLHFCEVITALAVLETGGNFVLKIFTTFEDSTISLLYLLNCVFTSVSIVKPATSKSGNSETYVINQQFKGHHLLSHIWPMLQNYYETPTEYKSRTLFSLSDIPENFLSQVDECAEYFMRAQTNTIDENIYNFGHDSKQYNCNLYKSHVRIANKFLTLYPIQPIALEQHIVPHELMCPNLRIGRMKRNSLFQVCTLPTECDLKTNGLELEIVYGKKVVKVLFSQFARLGDIQNCEQAKLNIFNATSLFAICQKHFVNLCNVMDFSAVSKNQSEANREVLSRLLSLFGDSGTDVSSNKNVLLVNLSLFSRFTIGLLYLVSFVYKVYFFQRGVIYLCQMRSAKDLCYKKAKDCLSKIDIALRTVPKQEYFDNDVIQVIDDAVYNNLFRNCIDFYNGHFLKLL